MKKKKKAKKIQEICNNCALYDRVNGSCKVAILHEGEEIHIPVDPQDKCFFTGIFSAINPETKQIENFAPDIKQIRWFVEDPETGKQSNQGVVKVEFPDDLFNQQPQD